LRARVCTSDGRVAPGAIIVQRVLLGPLAIEMAVRVTEVFDTQIGSRKAGFSYVTLHGHVERGVATFSITENEKSFRFCIESWSSPGTALAWLGRPFARPVQQAFTREALAHFRDHFRDR
jgi:uncharacterized protein (UPF0548 family)